MNDYVLINSLLEDGSEASLMKLKMIFDFEDYYEIYEKLNDDNLLKFMNLFYEFYERIFLESTFDINYIELKNRFNVIKIFKHVFEKHLIEDPSLIMNVAIEHQIEFIKLYFYIYKICFSKQPKYLNLVSDNNKIELQKMFPELKKQ